MLKTLLYDLLSAQPDAKIKYHGGGEYIKSLFKYLITTNDGEYQVIVFYDKDSYLDDWIYFLLEQYRIESFNVSNNRELQDLLDSVSSRCDILYTGLMSTFNNITFPKNLAVVCTLHGLRSLEIGFDSYKKYYISTPKYVKELIKLFMKKQIDRDKIQRISSQLKKYDRVIASSIHTEYAIKTWLDCGCIKQLEAAYPPPLTCDGIEVEDEEKTKTIGKYALMISADRYEKNICRAIAAFDDLFSKNLLSDTKVIICGGIPKRFKKRIVNPSYFIEYGYVTSSFLQALFKNCDFFVYPSVNEGFGYPPLEAMQYGKTCIVSAVCSLTEICGNVPYYINPFDVKEIENRILQAHINKKDPERVIQQYQNINRSQISSVQRIKEYILG